MQYTRFLGNAVQGDFDGPSGLIIKDSGAATSSVPSPDQKDALQGTSGTPSITNRYVTNDDPRNTNARPPTGAAGGDLASTYPNPDVVAVHESGANTRLPIGTVNDGQILQRQGASLVGTNAAGPFEDDPPLNVSKSAASAGVLNQASRGDHKHDVDTAAPITQNNAVPNTEGTATTLARSDHRHQFTVRSGQTLQVGQTSSNGIDSTTFSRGDHVHGVPATSPVSVDKSPNAPGTSTDFVRSDHKHDVSTASPPASPGIQAGVAAAEGTATTLARSDHIHHVDTSTGAGPLELAVGDGSLIGTANGIAKKDHQHGVPAATPVSVDKSPNAPGTATTFVRSDHKHDVSTGTPTGIVEIGDVGVEGAATTLARSDHIHPVGTPGNPADVTKAAASPGASVIPAREDHKHDVTTGVAVDSTTATPNAEGTATTLARSDHVHKISLPSQEAGSQAPAAQGLTATPAPITAMTITAATTGNFLGIVTLGLTSNGNNNSVTMGIYINGVLHVDSNRSINNMGNAQENNIAFHSGDIPITAGDTVTASYTATQPITWRERLLTLTQVS